MQFIDKLGFWTSSPIKWTYYSFVYVEWSIPHLILLVTWAMTICQDVHVESSCQRSQQRFGVEIPARFSFCLNNLAPACCLCGSISSAFSKMTLEILLASPGIPLPSVWLRFKNDYQPLHFELSASTPNENLILKEFWPWFIAHQFSQPFR